MSYQIDSIEVAYERGFRLAEDVLDALEEAHGDDAPEDNVFDYREHIASGFLPGKYIAWSGEGSGHAYDLLRDKILSRFEGDADLVLTWEGGDSHSGLRLRDGRVTEHEVVMSLGKERAA